MIATVVVQKGKVLFESSRSAAGPVDNFVLAAFLLEARPHHVLHCDVVVMPVGCAFTTAVTQQHCLIALITETQFAHCQLQLPQSAGLLSAGSFSPSGLFLSQASALPLLLVEQGSDHMLKLALREALEHHGKL